MRVKREKRPSSGYRFSANWNKASQRLKLKSVVAKPDGTIKISGVPPVLAPSCALLFLCHSVYRCHSAVMKPRLSHHSTPHDAHSSSTARGRQFESSSWTAAHEPPFRCRPLRLNRWAIIGPRSNPERTRKTPLRSSHSVWTVKEELVLKLCASCEEG